MIQPKEDGTYDMTGIDFDYTQRGWFIVDPGTLIWTANAYMWMGRLPDRDAMLDQMIDWFLEAYGWETTREELE